MVIITRYTVNSQLQEEKKRELKTDYNVFRQLIAIKHDNIYIYIYIYIYESLNLY